MLPNILTTCEEITAAQVISIKYIQLHIHTNGADEAAAYGL